MYYTGTTDNNVRVSAYGAVIMAIVISNVHPVRLMNADSAMYQIPTLSK